MDYDVIVVGGGHAGIEASLVSARMGQKTLLITMLVEQIGAASCNPAIGGLAKGHLVKELDALGGEMGLCTDATGIQFRILNQSKGDAVQGSRAQIDMDRYRSYMRDVCFKTENLEIYQDEVTELIYDKDENCVNGVITKLGQEFTSKKVILTAGTFISGLIHIGKLKYEAGRAWEKSSNSLSQSLLDMGLNLGRLKTGTPARVDGRSVDFQKLERHGGDENPIPFSFRTDASTFNPQQYPCYIAYTNENTHKIIEENFNDSALFSGQIQGTGPRYCPSIEDKVYRFKERNRHQLFLEPQTQNENEYYINGLSTSLSTKIQKEVICSVEGLENAKIVRYGYAIEYDYVDPTGLKHTLETKKIKNLYLAGQLNATTGYEEAAVQGFVAGVNASLAIDGKEPFILRRDEAYIGVLIDDLVTVGSNEPYRMFTSRAEFRLLLREQSADMRLSEYGYNFGLLDEDIYKNMLNKKAVLAEAIEFMTNNWFNPSKENLNMLESLNEDKISNKTLLIDVIGRNTMDNEKLEILVPQFEKYTKYLKDQIVIEAKYYRYNLKQEKQIAKMKKMLNLKIPENFSYKGISGLSNEVVEKLNKYTPTTLFGASQISGITPSAVDIIHLHIANKKG